MEMYPSKQEVNFKLLLDTEMNKVNNNPTSKRSDLISKRGVYEFEQVRKRKFLSRVC